MVESSRNGTALTIVRFDAENHSGAPDGPRLRNSCKACARSKLKCSQQRPACHRCLKRHIKCEYVAAKRGGRKPKDWVGPQSTDAISELVQESHFPNQTEWTNLTASVAKIANNNLHRTSSISRSSPTQSTSQSREMTEELFGTMLEPYSPFDDALPSSVSPGIDMHNPMIAFSHFDNNPFALEDELLSFELDLHNQSSSDPPSNTFSDISLLRDGDPTSTTGTSLVGGSSGSNFSGCISAPQFCISRTLKMMEVLSLPAGEAASQNVAVRNELAIDLLDSILTCPCSRDRYLLSIAALMLSKVLDRYGIVAHKTPTPGTIDSTISMGSQVVLPNATNAAKYNLGGIDSARMAVQLIISELHRLKRLVDRLSAMLKVTELEKQSQIAAANNNNSTDESHEYGTHCMQLAFGEKINEQLQGRIRALSAETIAKLRQL